MVCKQIFQRLNFVLINPIVMIVGEIGEVWGTVEISSM